MGEDAVVLESAPAQLPLPGIEPAAVETSTAASQQPPAPLTALALVENWWAATAASAPSPWIKSFDTHARERWGELAAALEGR